MFFPTILQLCLAQSNKPEKNAIKIINMRLLTPPQEDCMFPWLTYCNSSLLTTSGLQIKGGNWCTPKFDCSLLSLQILIFGNRNIHRKFSATKWNIKFLFHDYKMISLQHVKKKTIISFMIHIGILNSNSDYNRHLCRELVEEDSRYLFIEYIIYTNKIKTWILPHWGWLGQSSKWYHLSGVADYGKELRALCYLRK